MDPGNWATDLEGGSRYGYSLIWVLVLSNLMALVLQNLCARLGIVYKKDLAQVNRETYPPLVNFCLYLLAEAAIAAWTKDKDAHPTMMGLQARGIAAGTATVQATLDLWISSPGHCANLMGASYKDAALACASTTTAQFGRYWTFMAGAR